MRGFLKQIVFLGLFIFLGLTDLALAQGGAASLRGTVTDRSGDAFETNRHAVFEARNLFSANRGQLKQNQYEFTVGGPGDTTIRVIDLNHGWGVLQDLYDAGEKIGLYRREWNSVQQRGPTVSDWEPISRLAHLQLLFAPQPYFGRALHSFNQAPWWYRLEFEMPPGATKATLRFEGVDYYAKVWLNEKLLGEHEGYSDPFEFEVGSLLSSDKPNLLIVKVSSPWDEQVAFGDEQKRLPDVVRHMVKGTYEHASSIQRDVNPVGIWRPVRLILHDGLRTAGDPTIATSVSANASRANVAISWPVALDEGEREAEFTARIRSEPDGLEVARSVKTIRLEAGTTELAADLVVNSPKLWSTWDRGGPALYRLDLEIHAAGETRLASTTRFGVRTIELRRTPNETTFLLNGKPIYLRGATYWPDLYLSAIDRARYERDLTAAVRAGVNALRIHVHVENNEFYDLCDRMGIVLLQDSDLNWTFPTDEPFTQRVLAVVGAMIKNLRNHPSIIGWICINEAHGGIEKTPLAAHLVAEANRLDPTRPTIKNSWDKNDLESGDAHEYRGSLSGGHYTDIFGSTTKLSTEFGVDAPPGPESARLVPQIAERLKDVLPRVAELHNYQYWLTKYYIEHYRMQKYDPNGGYFLFKWSDFSPQTFGGIYDYWGRPKVEGLGGALRALEESNAPIGIFMEYKDSPLALHAVNDSPTDLGDCVAEWTVTTESGEVTKGKAPVHLGPDSHARVGRLSFEVKKGIAYRVVLWLRAPDGRVLARNVYLDPFDHPPHPEGHPQRWDTELGMRLWWAGEGK
jgi:beta-mannosidase